MVLIIIDLFLDQNLQATYDKGRDGMSTKKISSDVRIGDSGSANILGSQALHTITKNTQIETKKKKSDIRNYTRTEANGLVFGSEALQQRMSESGMKGNNSQPKRKTDLHGLADDGFAFGSNALHQITGAAYERKPRRKRKK